jgi:sugar diacid utilization regulator
VRAEGFPSGAPDRGTESTAGLRAIAHRIGAEREALARRVAERVSAEAGPSVGGSVAEVLEDRYSYSLDLIDSFVASLEGGEAFSDAQAERTRWVAARRAQERVPLGAFLRSARVWGEIVWEAVVTSTRMSEPAEREAAIHVASMLMRQVDTMSRVAADAYLDEVTDRGLLRRDLMDALVSGQDERSRRLARSLHLRLAENYIVVVIRGGEMHGEAGLDESFQGRVALDRIVESTRRHVQPSAGPLLAGVRQGDLIVLYPATGPEDLQLVRENCIELAKVLPQDVSLGMSASHRGLAAITTAYREAREAAEIADRLGVRGRAVGLEDVLVDHMLRASVHAQTILSDTMRPLIDYDRRHGSELIATLQTYVRTRFNLTKSASLLSVHPNTVVYRLGRIRHLAGRDPHDVDDLMVLYLGLKVIDIDLRSREAI